jgi:transposase|tara:strand:- start:21 stop:554 length:534 start_codon:yes stop_codon:yes gene_type:complete
VTLGKVEVWFQDEARVGQQGTLTRVWARKGTRPRLVKQQQFINSYIFGAVCPEKDKGAALVLPTADTSSMKRHLQEISIHVQEGYHAAVVLDQARWHVSKNLHIPKNITLIPLPPYSPELNPQENVWQFLRQNYLANRCFENLDEVIGSCCNAWNKLISDKGRIKSICSRDWACLST